MIVYKFMYCHMIIESSYETISIHKTLKGAYNAMREHKLAACNKLRNNILMYGYKVIDKDIRYDEWESWTIQRAILYA